MIFPIVARVDLRQPIPIAQLIPPGLRQPGKDGQNGSPRAKMRRVRGSWQGATGRAVGRLHPALSRTTQLHDPKPHSETLAARPEVAKVGRAWLLDGGLSEGLKPG